MLCVGGWPIPPFRSPDNRNPYLAAILINYLVLLLFSNTHNNIGSVYLRIILGYNAKGTVMANVC